MRLLVLASLVALVWGAAAEAATWKVGRAPGSCDGPCNYDDDDVDDDGFAIQYAMERPATIPGDTLLVYPGAYGAPIDMKSGVVLASAYGADTTSIDGTAGQIPGLFLVDTNVGTVVDGFTIRWDATTNGVGGGVAAYVSSGTIRNCVFDGCLASIGSAIYLQFCDLTLENNFFLDNVSASGGGAVTISGGAPTLERNTFVGSQCPPGFAGSTLYATGSSYVFDRNIVEGSLGGAAIFCGGTNNPTITCNVFWNNEFGTFGGTCPDSTGIADNVAADPLFCDPGAGDYGLCSDSPALVGPCGVIGFTWPDGNCGPCQPTPVAQLETETWARVKALYRN
jgi:hypothetical protein